MRWLVGIALVVWLAALALPQGRGDRESESAPRTRETGARVADEAYDTLSGEYRAAVAVWRSEVREARRDGRTFPPSPDAGFYPRFARLARGGSLPAAVWCLQRAGAPADREGLSEADRSGRRDLYRRLIDASATDPTLVAENLVGLIVREATRGLGREEALALSREFEQAARSERVRDAARYARARLLASPGATDADAVARARELYEDVRRLRPGSDLARAAADELWRLDHLAVGKTAPDFTTTDVFGNEIGLHDLRSSVVVVHFSRFLDPESRPSLLAFRDLVLELWDEDFVLLGVSADEDREEFLRQREAEDLSWSVAFEGSSKGAAASAWRVREWPQTFVLDGEGVIRFVGLKGRELSAAVRTLIEERER